MTAVKYKAYRLRRAALIFSKNSILYRALLIAIYVSRLQTRFGPIGRQSDFADTVTAPSFKDERIALSLSADDSVNRNI